MRNQRDRSLPEGKRRPCIALIDYVTVPNNPVGQVHRSVMDALCDEFEFVVFAVDFDNPRPERIRFVRTPAIRRPLILLFMTFHVSVIVRFAWERGVRRQQFAAVQSIESASVLGNIVHAQFCHRWFLAHQWATSRAPGCRGALRGAFERAAACLEGPVFRRADVVVAPSQGSVRTLVETFPVVAGKHRVAYNGIDIDGHRPPADFDGDATRRRLGLEVSRPTLVFVSLGHFERKGLPIVLDAMLRIGGVDLVVVGGTEHALSPYRRRASDAGLDRRVHFVGFAADVRPYLWAADAFILPSSFEGFPFVALEAAAAGLPLIVTPVNGVEEILVDGVTGLGVERSTDSVARAIERFLTLGVEERRKMAQESRASVERFSVESMVAGWRTVYTEVTGRCTSRRVQAPNARGLVTDG